MSFLYPLGLLGLIGVPLLIAIYILKNKYTEQVIPATYLWTLSERFLKRKNPISKITGILSLILQILAVILISVCIAQPSFTFKGGADDYLFILDGSASMNAQTNEQTHFEQGKARIMEIIENSANGSSYSLVYASNETTTVFENLTDKKVANRLVERIEPSYGNGSIAGALSMAQLYLQNNTEYAKKIYLITDGNYQSGNNVEVIPLSAEEENYSVSDLSYEISESKLTVTGNVWSHRSDKNLKLSLYLNGEEKANKTQTVSAKRGQAVPFTFEVNFTGNRVEFQSAKVKIEDTDSLSLDNECILYYAKSDSVYNTLLVSDSTFVQAALSSLGNVNLDVISPSEYDESAVYGLYIFDSFTPKTLPKDGAVWFINPTESLEGTGFTVQGGETLEVPGTLSFSTSSSSRMKDLLKNTLGEDIYIKKYVKCGYYRSFHTVLSHNGNPAVFAGTNAYGNREVVFSFHFGDATFALSYNFIPLMNNLFRYTFPEIISQEIYACGDEVQINALANCKSIRVDTPLGNVDYLDAGSDLSLYDLTETGTYKITMVAGDTTRTVRFYSEIPLSERYRAQGEAISASVEGETGNLRRDGVYNDLIIYLIILAVIFIADWAVYCYEQYQLR